MSGFIKKYALGIDLGTTYSCISLFRDNKAEIIPNEIGERTTPSIVTFLDNNIIKAGEQALYDQYKNAKNTIYSIKRIIGRFYNENSLKSDIEKSNWPFEVIEKDGRPRIKIEINNKIDYYYPEEISKFVLEKLIRSAEKYLDIKVDQAVITVPHNFTKIQREATEKAAKLAGINVLGLLSEPTAAALAYGLEKKVQNKNSPSSENLIFVFDLGGGTFDITLLKISENINNNEIFDVICCSGDSFLGGDDFDNILLEHCLEVFFMKNLEICNEEVKEKIKNDEKKMKELKKKCEKVKIILSNKLESTVYIEEFMKDCPLKVKIDRNTFEFICNPKFTLIENYINKVLKDSKKKQEDISEVVLIGGSSKIPWIKEKISSIFNHARINCDINPDEAVAQGAAIRAATIIDQDYSMINSIILFDITPLAIGTSVINKSQDPEILKLGYLMEQIIPRNTRIPISLEKTFSNVIDNQEIMKIDIYEGNKRYVKDNNLIGLFFIDIPPGPKGTVKVKVNMTVDINGILTVEATEISGNQSKSLIIKNDKEILSQEEYERIKTQNKQISENKNEIDEKNYKNNINYFGKLYHDKTNEKEKIYYLKKYRTAIKDFMNTFKEEEIENQTIFEKIFLYAKLLFESSNDLIHYCSNDNSLKSEIKEINKKYLQLLSKSDPFCIIELVDIYKNCIDKEILFDLTLFVMTIYYDKGIKCMNSNDKHKNYKARNEFQSSIKLYQKYINKELNTYDNLKKQIEELLSNNQLKINLIDSYVNLNISENNDNSHLFNNNNLNEDDLLILLEKHFEFLDQIYESPNDINIELESFVCANIVKIDLTFLKRENIKYLEHLEIYASQSISLAETIPNKNWNSIPWFEEIKSLLSKIKEKIEQMKKIVGNSVINNIRQIFETKTSEEFIEFIFNNYKLSEFNKLIEGSSISEKWKSATKNNDVSFLDDISALYQKQINQNNPLRKIYEEILIKLNKIKVIINGCDPIYDD